MPRNFTYDVFLSHSSKDKTVVRPLADWLRADGLRVWFDEWEVKPGDNIPAKIEEGLEHARVLVLCMSGNAFGSDWAQLESYTFRFRDPLNKERRFIPVRLDGAEVKGTLRTFAHIDFTESFEGGYKKLLLACRPLVNMIMETPTGTKASGNEMAEVVLRILEFDPEKELERYTLELRAALHKRFGPYSKWPQTLRNSLESSEFSNVLLFLGDLFSLEDDHEKAAEFYTRAIESAKAASAPKTVALAKIRLATALERSFKGEQALSVLRSLIYDLSYHDARTEEFWWARYQWGICLKGLRRLQDAFRVFEEVTAEAEPRDRHKTLALYQLGQIDAALGNNKRAEQTFLKCKAQMPENWWGHRRAYVLRGLGLVYLDQGRFEDACAELNEALRVAGKYLDFRYRNKVAEAMSRLVVSLIEGASQERFSIGQLAEQYALDDSNLHEVFSKLRSKGQRYVEIVDAATGQATGEVVKHDVAHKHGFWHAVAHVILVTICDTKIYILLRQRSFGPSKGKWDLAATGHLNVKESDFDAALRKARDELGLSLDRSRVVRLWNCSEFQKTGSPDEKEDFHENIRHFKYKTEPWNREKLSIFFYLVNGVEKAELIRSGRASINWIELTEACREAREHPEQFASGFRLINHPRLITWLSEEVRKHHESQ